MKDYPGCVLFVVQGSAAMDRLAHTAVRLHIDQALDHFLRHHGQRGPLDIGVVGYCRHGKRIAFSPLLPGIEHSTELVPLALLKSDERRQLRLDQLSFEGKAPPAEGLAHAHLILQRWLAEHPVCRPPVVIHCGGPRGYRTAHARLSRSIRLMGPAAGAIGLAHHVIAPNRNIKFLGEPGHDLSRKLRRLWKYSSPLTLKGKDDEAHPARALALNADPLPLVRGLLRQVRPLQLKASSARARMRILTLPGRGHTAETSEDAAGCNASHGLAVLSDGASSAVHAREWAQTLTASFLARRPEPAQPFELASWLHSCRKSWLRTIGHDAMQGIERERVERTGAAATFLAWQLGTLDDGSLPWRAWAVGDSCLFWIRGSRLRATFPLVHSRHFAAVPTLLSSWPQEKEPGLLHGAGVCRPGDLFVLASDAAARFLLADVEHGEDPDWNELETIPEENWRSRLQTLRDQGRIVNDDFTLAIARVLA